MSSAQKPSAGVLSVFMCHNVSCLSVQLKQLCWTQTDVAVNFPKDVDWLNSVILFLLFPSQTNQCLLQYQLAFCCTEMCIPNTTKAVFLYADYFQFHFSCTLLNLVTVRCTYWGPLWWRDSVILTVGKSILFHFLSGYVVAIVMTKKIPVMCTCPYVLLQWFSVS